ncbi:MAG: lysophospholipid acyltransferase family protein [Pseudomonadota bacterium]
MLEIESFLQSRYPDFMQRHRRAGRTVARFLGFLFYQSRFQQFGRDYPHLHGFDFVEQVLDYFDFSLRLDDRERARIPDSGRVVLIANHPIGSLDGLALLQLVRQVRPDVKVVANELLTAVEPLHPVLLPVHNMGGNTPRSNLRNIRDHLRAEGALIIFPAGEVSRFGARGVRDGEWHSGFVKIAASAQAPILPVHVAGRNSLFFYSLSFLARPLSTIWLVREMFKQSHNTVDARVGRPIPYEHYNSVDVGPAKLASMFRKHVYRLGKRGRPIFQSVETVAYPENRLLLRQELQTCERLGITPDGKQIYLCRMADSPCVMREIGRLREIAFRTVGEGSGLPRDIDRYDRRYLQLVLWDSEDLEIVGAYRIGEGRALLDQGGIEAFYTHSLFHYREGMTEVLQHGLELGRSFVQPRYQKRSSLDYLWSGIGAFVSRYPQYRFLFGPASISRHYGTEAMVRLSWYYARYYAPVQTMVTARQPMVISTEEAARIETEFCGDDRERDFRILKSWLSERGLPVPVLFKHYAAALEPGGVSFSAFSVDPAFGHCVDAFVLADLTQLKTKKRQRYLSTGELGNGSTEDRRANRLRDPMDI